MLTPANFKNALEAPAGKRSVSRGKSKLLATYWVVLATQVIFD